MKKTFVLFTVLFLSACSLNKNNSISLHTTKTWNIVEQKVKEKIDPHFQKYMKIVQSGNLTWCKLFTGSENLQCKYEILLNFDLIWKKTDCNVFSWTNFYTGCLDNFFYKNRQCENIKDTQNKKQCMDDRYFDKAIEDKTKYWCLYIKNKNAKKVCLEKIKDILTKKVDTNLPACKNVDILTQNCEKNDKDCQIKKLQFKFQTAISLKKKKNICEEIKKIDSKKYWTCMNNYYYMKALKYLDYKICENIKDKELKLSCINSAMMQQAIENADLKLCEKLWTKNDVGKCKDNVYLRIITRDSIKDKTICDKIQDFNLKKTCLDIVLKNF